MTTDDAVLALVERLAPRVPHLPRLAILDAVEAEWERLRAAAEPCMAPLVGPAALWRLRSCPDPAL